MTATNKREEEYEGKVVGSALAAGLTSDTVVCSQPALPPTDFLQQETTCSAVKPDNRSVVSDKEDIVLSTETTEGGNLKATCSPPIEPQTSQKSTELKLDRNKPQNKAPEEDQNPLIGVVESSSSRDEQEIESKLPHLINDQVNSEMLGLRNALGFKGSGEDPGDNERLGSNPFAEDDNDSFENEPSRKGARTPDSASSGSHSADPYMHVMGSGLFSDDGGSSNGLRNDVFEDEEQTDDGVDSKSSGVMSASEMPTYDSDGLSGTMPRAADDDTDYQSSTLLGDRQSSPDTTPSEGMMEESLDTPTHSNASHADVEKKSRFTFRGFRGRGGLISGSNKEEKPNEPETKSTNQEVDLLDLDMESANPEPNYATRAPRNLWEQRIPGLDSDNESDDQKSAEGVIKDDDEYDNISLAEKKGDSEDQSRLDALKERAKIFWERFMEYMKRVWERAKNLWGKFVQLCMDHKPIALAVGIFLFVVILVLSIVLGTRKNRRGSKGNPLQDTHDKIKAVVNNLVAEEILNDPTSPEAKTLSWMLNQDSIWTSDADAFSESKITQRFVLVDFHNELEGTLYWKANNWLQGDECGWDFVSCNAAGELHAMAFDNVGLTGQIPSYIGRLEKVENFILKQEYNVRGTIPPTIGHMKSLKQLGIYYTQLTGEIPKEIYQSSKLKYINFQQNDLVGSLSPEIAKLTNLETLVLMDNNFNGTVPWQALSSTKLKFLGLSNNEFTGSIVPLPSLATMEFLYLDNNKFTGEILPAISNWHRLRSVNLDKNELEGALPMEIGQLQELQFLSAQYNDIVGHIPETIRQLQKLETLALGSNRLGGPLPDIGVMAKLENVYLFDNLLTGPISDSVFAAPELKILFLSSNIFTGELPEPLSTVKNQKLLGLYMSDNHFEGHIPPSYCNFESLQALFLDENSLFGEIPECIGQLTLLNQLYLFRNELSGAVPPQLSQLPELQGIGLEDNELEGAVPDEVCSALENREAEFWLDCGGSSPEVQCPCCTTCCDSEMQQCNQVSQEEDDSFAGGAV